MSLKEFIPYRFQERGSMPCYSRPGGETPGLVRRQKRGKGKAWLRVLTVFSVEKARKARENSLGLKSLNVSGLWAVGVVFSCLVLDSR